MHFKTNLKASFNLIDLTPLVDVIFLMLIFFIITSDILPLKSLNIENPTLDHDAAPLTTQLFVVMDAQNVIYLGSKKNIIDPLTLKESLNKEIKLLKEQNGGVEPTVVVSIDRRVEYGPFLKLFNSVQECCSKMRLVYKPGEDKETGYF
ncbi:MAG: biopolymer transporter ExbD [Chlamydiales bacterium]|nr:biopolymer transporter ExbD [Chlamydiia bacterium]MCP5507846.1 biopolymer transporter ExbD [Chlamydiales bacterium]